ncbi:MAG TPA: PDZ domain-containing protein [Pirellulales bacterium]|nr:PDZ domain-containing protein [Pirellulales bacterium]
MTGNLGRFFAAALLIAAAPARLHAEEPAQGIDPSLIIEQFDVFNDGDLLLVPVTAFGKTRTFVFDTGCAIMLYDKSLRPFLGKPRKSVIGSTPQGKVTVEMFDSPKTLLGKLSLHTEQPVGCVDLRQMSQLSGHDIAGFVGISMLQHYVVQIDFDAGKLAFLKQVPEHAGERFEFTWLNGGVPAIQAEMSGFGSELFLIDTGFLSHDAGKLNPETAATLTAHNLAEAKELRTYSRDLSGTIVQKLLSIKGLRLGSHRMFDVPMSTGEPKKPSMLSLGLLSRFIVTFDFPNRAIYLKKGKQFDRPFRLALGGIIFVRKGGDVVVEAVREDRPAAKAGIKVKDVLKVGEQETSGARLFKLYDEFRSPGQIVRVKLMRGDQIIEADVKLPDEDDKDSADKPQDAGS